MATSPSSPPSASSPAGLLNSRGTRNHASEAQLLASFAADHAIPYGIIPPSQYMQIISASKGKARAIAPVDSNTARAPSDLSIAFARGKIASHTRTKSHKEGSSDGLDGVEFESKRLHRPIGVRRRTHEERAARQSRRQVTARDSNQAESSRASSIELVDGQEHRSRTKGQRQQKRLRTKSSRSVAPLPFRTCALSQASTSTASPYLSILGQPPVASPSISAPEKSSAAATCAALPSLYQASRGRSAHVSPSRRWDRRCASASVLSGSEDASDMEASRLRRTPRLEKSRSKENRLSRMSLSPSEGALFPSDDDEALTLSSSEEEAGKVGRDKTRRRRRSRRWSSVERDRRRGLRLLLSPGAVDENGDVAKPIDVMVKREAISGLIRRISASSELTTSDCTSELDASPSSCSSSSDIAGDALSPIEIPAGAIPILTSRSLNDSDGARGGSGRITQDSASLETSDPASTPSTSLIQRSPPALLANKPIVAIPISSEADPLLGFTSVSIEDMIRVDQVEFCSDDTGSEMDRTPRMTGRSTKTGKKLSWIISNLDEDGERPGALTATDASQVANIAPTNSYQARLASLQNQLRIWSRGEDGSRSRQASAGSEAGHAESGSTASLITSSWRSLARLPNLILLPGLAARQARESLSTSPSKTREASHVGARIGSPPEDPLNDLAAILKKVGPTTPISQETLEARKRVAMRMGRPPSPSPSPSAPTSMSVSRQSSSDRRSWQSGSLSMHGHDRMSRKSGRGVATPIEGDRDPSAYVSGLGQPIDPDTELASVVHLQTFRSRSRSRPTGRRPRQESKSFDDATNAEPKPDSPKSPRAATVDLKIDMDSLSPPKDIASALTSPTYRRKGLGSDSSDSKPSSEDDDGFRLVQSRRHRRRSSGPRSTRPKVEAPVPRGYSAFAIEEEEREEESEPERPSRSRRRASPTRARTDKRQCAVGLFGGGNSTSPIRSVRSSPDLSYAAAAMSSPPRGSRGRRGIVKVVASSIGQFPPPPRPLTSDTNHRLLSNSSHLLMLSLELEMIKNQKISAPLKPRWGKHRANDFNGKGQSGLKYVWVP